MKVVCEIRNDNNFKKVKIITSMILLLSALFLIRVKLHSETKISGVELSFSQFRNTENSKNSKKQILEEFYAEENKERIIVNSENGLIYNSIKQVNSDRFSLSEQMQKNLQKIAEHLNEEQINSIYSNELCSSEENANEESYADLLVDSALYAAGAESFISVEYSGQQNSFGDF